MFCYYMPMFNEIFFILKYVFQYILKSVWSTFWQNWFISYFSYSSTLLVYSNTLHCTHNTRVCNSNSSTDVNYFCLSFALGSMSLATYIINLYYLNSSMASRHSHWWYKLNENDYTLIFTLISTFYWVFITTLISLLTSDFYFSFQQTINNYLTQFVFSVYSLIYTIQMVTLFHKNLHGLTISHVFISFMFRLVHLWFTMPAACLWARW